MIEFIKTNIEEALPDYLLYTAKLRLVDSYWEWYIIDADIYDIVLEGDIIGHFSIHEQENMLSSFLVYDKYVRESQDIFLQVLCEFEIKLAQVVTNDELLLSLCMDKQTAIEVQAYFFDDGHREVSPPFFEEGRLCIATNDDLPELIKTDFFHPLLINNEEDLIYVMRNDDGDFMGAGHIHKMKLQRKWGCVGMVVADEYRQMGVGRSIIYHLKDIVKQNGLIAIAGCWRDNFGSRKTLESCGFQTKTRLLKVYFE